MGRRAGDGRAGLSRRGFIAVTGAWSALATVPLVLAQQAGNVPRIGLLWIHSPASVHLVNAFREAMHARGYVDGKNIHIDESFLVDGYEAFPAAAARLVSQKVSLIAVYGSTAVTAASNATKTIPIVIISGGDPVRQGVAANLAKPGGNVTGLSSLVVDLSGKRLELLKEITPSLRTFATLLFPGSEGEQASLRSYESAAKTLGLESRAVEIRNVGEIEPAIAAVAKLDVQAIAVIGSTLFNAHRPQLVAAIARLRKPAIYVNSDFVEAGGLISYGLNFAEIFRGAATFVDRILKGAKPGDLPIEQPTKFELVVNLKTAKALGLTLPQPFLMRADRVIE